MALVYSYIRFSSKKQMTGDSFRRQIEASDSWIAANNHTPAALTLHDLGVSSFRGQNRETGALGQFLAEIGHRVQPGSILLLENLDRLSRQGIQQAYRVFQDILNAGVEIVCLRPYEMRYTRHSLDDMIGIMVPLMYFHLAHIESKNKSDRLLSRRKKLRDQGGMLDKFHPAWMDFTGDSFTLNSGADAIQYIFTRTTEGIGQTRLVGELQRKYPAIGRSGKWTTAYVSKILLDRSVLGERQNHTFTAEGDRVPIGEPTRGYYPAAIDEALWNRAQGAKGSIAKRKGPVKSFVNLFTGIVHNSDDGSAMHLQTGRLGDLIQRRLVSYDHLQRVPGASPVSVQYADFEAVFLHYLREVTSEDLAPADNTLSTIRALQQEEAGINGRLADLHAALADPGTKGAVRSLVTAIEQLETRRDQLAANIANISASLRGEQPLVQAKSAVAMLTSATGPELVELRHRLRGLISELVESIWCKPEKHYGRVYCVAQVFFRAGLTRAYNWGPGTVGGSQWQVTAAEQGFDLRKPIGRPLLRGIADLLVDPAPAPTGSIPEDLRGAADYWLATIRARMAASSYRVVPSKVDRLVDFLGGTTPIASLTDRDWSQWVRHVQLLVGERKLERSTARVTLARSREFLRWAVEQGVVRPLEGLLKSPASLLP